MKNEKWDIYKPAFRKIRQSCPDLLADCWGRRTDFPSLRGRGPESAPLAATAIREHWTCKLLLSIFLTSIKLFHFDLKKTRNKIKIHFLPSLLHDRDLVENFFEFFLSFSTIFRVFLQFYFLSKKFDTKRSQFSTETREFPSIKNEISQVVVYFYFIVTP